VIDFVLFIILNGYSYRLENLPYSIGEMRKVWDRIESVISSVKAGATVCYEDLSVLIRDALSLKVHFYLFIVCFLLLVFRIDYVSFSLY